MDPDPAFQPHPFRDRTPLKLDPDALDIFDPPTPEKPPAKGPSPRGRMVPRVPRMRRTLPRGRQFRGVSVMERERQILALLEASGRMGVETIAQRIGLGVNRVRAIVSNLKDAGVLDLRTAPSRKPSGGRPLYLFGVAPRTDDTGSDA